MKKKSLVAAASIICYYSCLGGGFVGAFSPSIPPSTRFDLSGSYGRNISVVTAPVQRNSNTKVTTLSARQWEGDDIRWIRKLRRRFTIHARSLTPAKTTLICLNIALFLYQVVNSVDYTRRKHPEYWPRDALLMIFDALMGTSILGPLTADFVHQPMLSRWQPHRYLTAGFLHGNLIHLVLNMRSLQQAPSWLETGLGWKLFISTFLFGIASGNVWDSWSTLNTSSMCLGASGGICALYGLMFVAVTKMGNSKMGTRVLKSMGVLLLLGLIIPNVSNAAHIGGFFGGVAFAVLCCPYYRKSYLLSRKNSLEVDPADREYRLAMGFGKVPTRRGLVPVTLLWAVAIVALASQSACRQIPMNIYQGLLKPGILSNMRSVPVPPASL